MADASRATYLTRDTILKLLSDEEVARISTAENMPALSDGAEFLDLENLDPGVEHADASTKITMGNVLPRSAVLHEVT
jgi:hypothetical protein